jgi:SAM-dependent methyltransferase
VTDAEKRRWDERADSYDAGEAPAPVLRDAVADLPSGRALDVATGHGRNAIFLAERGWTVDAVDISRAMLDPARDRAAGRGVSVNWLLADVDDYCFPTGAYDVVTISFFDARDRLDAIQDALAPGGALCYEHHLVTDGAERGGPGARYRFEPGELRAACSGLAIERYDEDLADRTVRLVGRKPE